MSMNVAIFAKRTVIVEKTGERQEQIESFDCWQTPTNITYAIVRSDNPIEAYKTWVAERGKRFEREELLYAEDDIFYERDPISTEIYNPANDHLECLSAWIKDSIDNGYCITVEVI